MKTLAWRLIGAFLICLAGCAQGASSSSTPVPATTRAPLASTTVPLIWMIGQVALPTVTADSQATQILVGRKLYIILSTVEPIPQAAPSVPAGWTPTWVYRWTSEEQMASDFASGSVPSWISIVMYDNEPATSPATPTIEQYNPPYYTAQAASVAHANGRQFWMTAGLSTSNPNYPGGVTQERVDEWATSSNWDGYGIQSQTDIDDIASFDSLIANQTNKADAAATKPLSFSAGIGDFASGTFVGLTQIEAAVPTIPSGYAIWMNFGPHAGPGCTDPTVCPIPARYDMIPSLIDYFQ